MSTEPRFLFRVQHSGSQSKYTSGIGVVATKHLLSITDTDVNSSLENLTRDVEVVKTTDIPMEDLLSHLNKKSVALTSCVSTSDSLVFALFWAQFQYRYHHEEDACFLVIDVPEIKKQSLQFWGARARLDKNAPENLKNFARVFREYIIEVYVPKRAIVRRI